MGETDLRTLRAMRLAAQAALDAAEPKPPVLRRVLSFLFPSAIYGPLAFGVDVSHWDGARIDALQPGDVDFLIGKIGGTDNGSLYVDATWPHVVEIAYSKLDVPCFGFWMTGPEIWIFTWNYSLGTLQAVSDANNPILQAIIQQLHAGTGWKACYGVFEDVEEASLDDDGASPSTRQVSPQWLMWECKKTMEGLTRIGHPHLQLGVYSRNNFMVGANAPGRDVSTYLGQHPEYLIWDARYFTPATQPTTTAGLRGVRPPDTMKPLGFGYTVPDRPKVWDFWQFGIIMGYDVDLYNGPKDELYRKVGFVPKGTVPPEQPPTNPDIEALVLRMKAIEDALKADETRIGSNEAMLAQLENWAKNINLK